MEGAVSNLRAFGLTTWRDRLKLSGATWDAGRAPVGPARVQTPSAA
jgi:hypothetical protein